MSEVRNKMTTEFTKGSSWLSKAKKRKENRTWLESSFSIALRIRRYLKVNKISQKELAESLSWSPQYINKVLKGKENLTLETIGKLEEATGLTLIEVSQFAQHQKNSKAVRLGVVYNHVELFTGPKQTSVKDSGEVKSMAIAI